MYIYISQLIKVYTLHMYCLLYVNYSIINLFKNKLKHNKNISKNIKRCIKPQNRINPDKKLIKMQSDSNRSIKNLLGQRKKQKSAVLSQQNRAIWKRSIPKDHSTELRGMNLGIHNSQENMEI